VDLEMPGWATLPGNELKAYLNGQPVSAATVAKANYHSLFIPIRPQTRNQLRLEAGDVFPLPGTERERSFLIKNVSFENLSRTDLFARGWHRSGYLFSPGRIDQDGWVEREVTLRFPATTAQKQAVIEVVRYPSRTDYPLTVQTGGASRTVNLGLDATERLSIPLSATTETVVRLSAERIYTLSSADSRERSFRIANIDFE